MGAPARGPFTPAFVLYGFAGDQDNGDDLAIVTYSEGLPAAGTLHERQVRAVLIEAPREVSVLHQSRVAIRAMPIVGHHLSLDDPRTRPDQTFSDCNLDLGRQPN